MPLIFIDSSIWLGFWKIADGRLSTELLPATVSLADNIFMSRQIADEVTRRKLDAFTTAAGFAKPKLPREFPPHLLSGQGTEQWSEARDALMGEFDRLSGEWNERADEIAEQISRGEDPASVALARLFDGALEPTDEQLQRARLRYERGNPPGKQGDKLGDQIAWEQLLDAGGEQELWLATTDGDYGLICRDDVVLNPFLYAEIQQRRIEIRTFTSLVSLIRHAGEAGLPVRGAPEPQRLEEIEREEAASSLLYSREGGRCPACHTGELYGPTARPGPFGFAWYWTCTKCGVPVFCDDYCD